MRTCYQKWWAMTSSSLTQVCLKVLYYDIMDARFSYLSHLEWSLCQRVHDADRLQIIIACLQRIC